MKSKKVGLTLARPKNYVFRLSGEYQQKIMDHGVAHLVYHHGAANIINPYSEKGYEMLSDEFISFLEKYRPVIPPKVPIVLEIVGDPLSKEEKTLIDNTIWTHFCMAMAKNDAEVKDILKTSLWYFIFAILSTALIFAVSRQFNDVVTNLGYIPFYFFGYRVLIYLLIDCQPCWKRRIWFRRLAAVKLIFSERNSRSFDTDDLSEVTEEFTHYEEMAEAETRGSKTVNEFLMENGTAKLGCTVRAIEDLIGNTGLKGREYLSDAISSYLVQAEPFIDSSSPVSLVIHGPEFRDEEQQAVIRAIKNYYGLRMAAEEDDSIINIRQIIVFALFAALSAAVLTLCGANFDAALYECFIMALWFFGDYFLEFILISQPDYKEKLRTLENFRNMTVTFEHSEG